MATFVARAKTAGILALRSLVFGLIVVALLLPVAYAAAWLVSDGPTDVAGAMETGGLVLAGLAIRLLIALGIIVAVVVMLLPLVYGVEGARLMMLRAAGFEHVAGLTWRRRTFYTPAHTWLRRRAQVFRVGVDDLAGHLLRRIDAIVLPAEGLTVKAGAPLVALTRGGRRIEIPSPIDGVVRHVNARVAETPSVVVQDPYRRGWLVDLEPATGGDPGVRDDTARTWFADDSRRLASALEHATGVVAADGGELVVPPQLAISEEQFASLAREFLAARVT